jgi:hypothetical protein
MAVIKTRRCTPRLVACALALLASAAPVGGIQLCGLTSRLDGANTFARLDTSTGRLTAGAAVDRWQFLDAVYRPATGAYVGLGPDPASGDYGFVTFNTTTGAQGEFLPLRAPFSSDNVPENLQLDAATDAVYAVSLGSPPGLYRIDLATGATELAVADPALEGVISEVSLYDASAQLYAFFGDTGGASGATSLTVVDVANKSVARFAIGDSFDIFVSAGNATALAHNDASSWFVRLDLRTGAAVNVSHAPTGGIPSDQTAALVGGTVFVVVVDPKPTPAQYEVLTMDVASGAVAAQAVEGNTDMAFTFPC